jgi:hypothetical protein
VTIQSRLTELVQVSDPPGPLDLEPINQPPQLHYFGSNLIGQLFREVPITEASEQGGEIV